MEIRRLIHKLSDYSKRIKEETGRTNLATYFDYISALILHGCSIRQYYVGGFYRLPNYMRWRTVTYRRWNRIMNVFNTPSYICKLDNKVEFLKNFSKFISREWYYAKDSTRASFSDFLENNKTFIVKPVCEMQGKGVALLKSAEFKDTDELYNKIVKEDLLCEELIHQDPEMCFGNKSVNTIRVFTILDRSGKAHIMKTVLRAGKGEAIVDNFCAGGVVYPLDSQTGIVCGKGMDANGVEYMIHPGTKLCMLGYQVPRWNEVMDFVKNVAETLPQMRFVGWDLAISKIGVDLVEGNHNPDHEFLEFIGERGLYNSFMQYK